MAIQIRPGYVNPLTMMADKKTAPKLGQPSTQPITKQGKADKVAELQTKHQQLQNQMLLLKATGTDSGGATAETQKIVAEDVVKASRDLYEPEKAETASPGIYQIVPYNGKRKNRCNSRA